MSAYHGLLYRDHSVNVRRGEKILLSVAIVK